MLARTLLGHAGTAQGSVLQAARYLTDSGLREAIRARIATSLDAGTRVLIAHSLGSVVAWEVCAGLQLDLPLLVTVGSPLAETTAVIPRLDPSARWPVKVQRWLNVTHQGDLQAFNPRLGPAFSESGDRRRVEQHVTVSSHDHHGVAGYLIEVEVGRAVMAAISDLAVPPTKIADAAG